MSITCTYEVRSCRPVNFTGSKTQPFHESCPSPWQQRPPSLSRGFYLRGGVHAEREREVRCAHNLFQGVYGVGEREAVREREREGGRESERAREIFDCSTNTGIWSGGVIKSAWGVDAEREREVRRVQNLFHGLGFYHAV